MKILTITSNDLGISWGPAIHYLELWNEMVDHSNFEVTGICPSWTKQNNIVAPNFELKTIKIPDVKGIRQVIYDFKVFCYLISNQKKYNLLYIRLSHWHLLQIIFLMMSNKDYVLELNGLSKEDSISSRKGKLTSYLINLQEKWLVENAKINICVSEGIENTIKNRYKKTLKTITIPNGVATRFFKKSDIKKDSLPPLKVGYVGTFTAWDGAEDIVELARHFPDITFIMVGEGQLRHKIQKSAPENVIFTGKLNYSELPDFYSSIDAAIVLYEIERHRNVKLSSLKTLEYVASNLPVFSTNANGQEFIQEKGYGLLHEENSDIIESFNTFIHNLDVYRKSYAATRQDLISSFGWKRTALDTINAIQNLKG